MALAGIGTDARADAPEGEWRRIVALDWGLAATAIAIDAAPVGIAEPAAYRTWVVDPPISAGCRDVGLRLEPNIEILDALRPDIVLIGPLSEPARPVLSRIAPVVDYAVFTAARNPLGRIAEITREIGRHAGRPENAETLLHSLDAELATARSRLAGLAQRRCLIVQFVDGRHVRVHGHGSLFDAVLRRAGLDNPWTRPTEVWGTSTAPIEALAEHPDDTLLVVEPTPPDAQRSLSRPGLWQSLPQIRAGRVVAMPAAWAYGEATAAIRFARLLVSCLTGAPT